MDLMNGKTKEVDEWLMGSGESAETAMTSGLKNQPSFRIIDSRVDASKNNVADRRDRKEPEAEDQEENWMFKTFKKETVIIPAATNDTTTVSPDLKKPTNEMNIQENQDEEKVGADPFSGLDDFIMNKRIEPTHQEQDASV